MSFENTNVDSLQEINEFKVDKSKNQFYIDYKKTNTCIIKLDNDWRFITKKINELKDAIMDLNEDLKSEDYDFKTSSVINAIEDSIRVLDKNVLSLINTLNKRLKQNAQSDEEFSKQAIECIKLLQGTSLGMKASRNIISLSSLNNNISTNSNQIYDDEDKDFIDVL